MERRPQYSDVRASTRRDSVRVRSLDQFYRYVEKQKDKAPGSEQQGESEEGDSAPASAAAPAARGTAVAAPTLRYVLRNGITIPLPAEEPTTVRLPVASPPPASADSGEPLPAEAPETLSWSALRDAEDAERWRRLPHSIQVLAHLMHPEDPDSPDATGERRQLLERLLNPMLSLEDTARLLGVCSATVRRWANKGTLPPQRTIGGQRRFYLADVLTILERREDEGAAEEAVRSGQ